MFLANFFQIFTREYIIYALIIGVMMSISLALLGVSLVLKKQSMIGDGLSHVGFGACAIAASMSWAPLYFAIPVVIVASILILLLSQKSKVYGDSAIALASTTALAVGYAAIELSNGVSFNLESFLYGSLLGTTLTEVIISVIIGVIVILFFIFFYNRIFVTTFDETFAKSCGVKSNVISALIAILTSITVVIGMKVMGALLITSLIIFPVISARQIFTRFKSVLVASLVFGVIAFLIGLLIACLINNMPIGSSIVFASLLICLISLAISKLILKR